jgi:hypothetical protein
MRLTIISFLLLLVVGLRSLLLSLSCGGLVYEFLLLFSSRSKSARNNGMSIKESMESSVPETEKVLPVTNTYLSDMVV